MPFYILIIDFILTLSESKKKYDYIISIIDKYSRRITLISKKIIFSTEE